MLNKTSKLEIPEYITNDKDISIKFPKDISQNLQKDHREFYLFFNYCFSISNFDLWYRFKQLTIFIS